MVQEATVAEFEQSWSAHPDNRYGYELNKRAVLLFTILLGVFWSYWAITVFYDGADLILSVLGGLFVMVTSYVLFVLLKWRHFGRLSGAVCEDNRLLWRSANEVFCAPWAVLDLDGIGLLHVEDGQSKYEHALSIQGHALYLFRPFVKMRRYELFIGDILIRLKSHGRIQNKAGANKPKKKRKR